MAVGGNDVGGVGGGNNSPGHDGPGGERGGPGPAGGDRGGYGGFGGGGNAGRGGGSLGGWGGGDSDRGGERGGVGRTTRGVGTTPHGNPSSRRAAAIGSFSVATMADLNSSLRGLVSQDVQNYDGVLGGAKTGLQGYGIGDSLPGGEPDSRTAQEISRSVSLDNPIGLDTDLGKRYGLQSTISQYSNSGRGLAGQLAHENSLTTGARTATTVAGLRAMPIVIWEVDC